MSTLQPELSQLQSNNHYHRTFLKKHANRLKKKPAKAQKTISKQSQCTVAQQLWCFKLYEKALCFLRTKNTRECNKTGKLFGELINHFILGGDETNLIADADGELRIVGEKGKKKHEKNVADYRGSITMYRTGVAAGVIGHDIGWKHIPTKWRVLLRLDAGVSDDTLVCHHPSLQPHSA